MIILDDRTNPRHPQPRREPRVPVDVDGTDHAEPTEGHHEEWRAVPGYPEYEVSDEGRVRSWKSGQPLILRFNLTRGYRSVSFSNGAAGRRYFKVHLLVLLAFIGPRPEGLETRHLDGDELNNTLGNLRYGTHSENEFDRVRHGTHHGCRSHCRRGHEYTPENTRPRSDHPGRICRTCDLAVRRRGRARKAEQRVGA